MSGPESAEAGSCSLLTPLEEAVWFGMLRTHTVLTKAIDAELTRVHRLPLSSFEVLVHVMRAEGGHIGMSDLARLVLLTPSGLSRLVDRLEQDGLLCRGTSDDDARAVRVAITERGVQRLDEAARTHMEVIRERLLSRMSESEMRQLAAVWQRVT